jgi:hypothetical protein
MERQLKDSVRRRFRDNRHGPDGADGEELTPSET